VAESALYLCYVDESGTPDIPGNTSHFVLAGLAIPIWHWKRADADISAIMARYSLSGSELHTAWLLRPYLEQDAITGFEALSHDQRRVAVQRARNQRLLKLQQKPQGHKAYKQARKNFEKSAAYIHLTRKERSQLALDVADCVAGWGYARLFVECIDKIHFDPTRASKSIEEQAFEQIVSRFERYLKNVTGANSQKTHGIIVHDNNETVARKHTALMRRFHMQGTPWTNVDHLIETPMFVDSSLTSIVQVADLCAYAIRRYVENREMTLFRGVFERTDRVGSATVGARHFTRQPCDCLICASHA
jgi:Protein of unknown function (DUF3800)